MRVILSSLEGLDEPDDARDERTKPREAGEATEEDMEAHARLHLAEAFLNVHALDRVEHALGHGEEVEEGTDHSDHESRDEDEEEG